MPSTSRRRSGSGMPARRRDRRRARRLHPDLEIDWLAQHPVTTVLETRGERIHPLSAELASESPHITSESSEHDLNAFQAIRRDGRDPGRELHVFHDAVEDGDYDLVIGDEAWDVDHFLHENPELKRTAFAWMTDFVGWLPMPTGGDREAYLTADYNAEMIEHVERVPERCATGRSSSATPTTSSPRLRPGSARHPDWTERQLRVQRVRDRVRPAPLIERPRGAAATTSGIAPDERVVIVTVGGSGVGEALLRRVVDAYTSPRRRCHRPRMIAVAGRGSIPPCSRLGRPRRRSGYVPACTGIWLRATSRFVQGGLTTTMELVAGRRPFLYSH